MSSSGGSQLGATVAAAASRASVRECIYVCVCMCASEGVGEGGTDNTQGRGVAIRPDAFAPHQPDRLN